MNNAHDLSKKSKNVSRRNFLGTAGAAAAAFTIVPRHVMAGKGYLQPSDTVNVAGIGIGSQGGGDIQQICTPEVQVQRGGGGGNYRPPQAAEKSPWPNMGEAIVAAMADARPPAGSNIKLANIYALCDVDSEKGDYMFKSYPRAKVYSDWRVMLEKEPSIDAVVIGTPDHNHATIAAAFIKEKKHIYVEKPMAKTIYECRKLTELAKQYDVVTQMGNQGHATEGTRRTVEWIQSGVIGNVREVYLCTDRPTWPQGNLARPEGVRVPKNLNYDVWLGPAPNKPYHPDILHFNWRGLWDYGVGAMGDIGAHAFDQPVWALNLHTAPKIRIQAATTPFSEDYLPAAEWITYEFPERFVQGVGYMPPVKVIWCDGGLMPPRPDKLEPGRAVLSCLYIGDKGIMMHADHGGMPTLVPEDKDFTGPDPWLPRTGLIFEDWINAIRNGTKSSNDFSYASQLTEIMLLTNVAVLSKRANVTLEYDVPDMKITNFPEANDLFHYDYREGWSL
ncbi:MAG: Gfo/Idh/MocA family oxidoreductase [Bacteroidales bacterium]|nr:Gfo/Idh/MocA family oxidoreductase [Bacteroidales bacterium]